ncbi:vWA domain-containing protein [Photobacterium atrarenae]|uniref:VWA domain-containing protein n=1 Tax=Photobacterium atrarenae TaxID=865757 RepID=A0ABY5GMP0_9GAMM|nr:vWA domain-containing protein [Photobacterium atrarenae]UTV30578.1 VWA domain-containing protein [Photobacterium atrarenae]
MKKELFTLTVLAAALLSGCNSSNSSGESKTGPGQTPDTTPAKTTFSGTLVTPEPAQVTAQKALFNASRGLTTKATDAACPNVPTGYYPLSNAAISLVANNDAIFSETTTTDACGQFTLEVEGEDTAFENSKLVATSDNFKTLEANAQNFMQTADQVSDVVASTIAKDASYVINGIQKIDNDTLAFSITDSQSGKAVIQVAKGAFQILVNANENPIVSLNTADQLQVRNSIVMTLDASGSMSSKVYDEQGDPVTDSNDVTYNRFRLTALAAHQFMMEKNVEDEVAVIPFSLDVNLISKSFLDGYSFLDENGVDTTISYSDSGFMKDKASLHFAIDFYNMHVPMWEDRVLDTKHAGRTDNVHAIYEDYPWGGGTELEDSIHVALDTTKQATGDVNSVFVMTDGNARFNDLDGLIAKAKSMNLPVHSIAISNDAYTQDLIQISEQTGGSFKHITDVQNITGVYSALQTTVKFNYVANLTRPVMSQDVLKIILTLNGEVVEREVTLN